MTTIPSDAQVVALAESLYPMSAAPDALKTAWVEQARTLAGVDAFGATLTLALAHLVGHYVETWLRATAAGTSTGGGSTGVAGPVVSSRSSTLAISHAAGSSTVSAWSSPTATDAALMQTPGGQAYIMLRDSRAAVAVPTVA